jgi:ADP-ribose pyrophosphatase
VSDPPVPSDPAPRPESVDHVFEGPLFRVEVQRWPGGVRRDIVRHLNACGAVVFVDGSPDRTVLLVRQLREAVGRSLLEIPAGVYDQAGEPPDAAIRREIVEETGHRVVRLEPLGHVYSSPGFADERIDLFVAWASPAGPPAPDDGETLELVRMPFDEALAAIDRGEIVDAKSVAALFLTDRRGRGAGRGG